MDGKQLSELFIKWKMCNPLTAKELANLANGLHFLWQFNAGLDYSPEAIYYGTESESVKRTIEAMKQDQ